MKEERVKRLKGATYARVVALLACAMGWGGMVVVGLWWFVDGDAPSLSPPPPQLHRDA